MLKIRCQHNTLAALPPCSLVCTKTNTELQRETQMKNKQTQGKLENKMYLTNINVDNLDRDRRYDHYCDL